MELERISSFLGQASLTIVDAMGKIDLNSKGILFIVDENGKLEGALTDGDIRRWIIKTGDITTAVKNAMNKKPKSLTIDKKDSAVNFMKKSLITAVPIVDDNNKIIDIIVLSEVGEEKKKKESLDGVPVVIMAGGKGTRLYPYTKILPKPLIPIGDTPIVERILDYYKGFGIKSFYMTVNYKKAMIRSYFEELNPDYTIKYVEETKPLGTGGSIKLIKDKFDKPIFITNCDTIIIADYGDIYKYHVKSGNDITMVSALKNNQIPYGVIHTGDNGSLKSMDEKPKISYFINTGMYIVNPKTIELIPDDTMFHMTHLVEAVMKNGGKVGTYPVSEDSFLDMGEFDEMKRMEEKLGVFSGIGKE